VEAFFYEYISSRFTEADCVAALMQRYQAMSSGNLGRSSVFELQEK